MRVDVSLLNGLYQTENNVVTLYLNGLSVSGTNLSTQACAGTSLGLKFSNDTVNPPTGNSAHFPDREWNFGTIVANGGQIYHWNGSSWTKETSPTTNNLLGVDNCVDASGNTMEVVAGADGTILENKNNQGYKLLANNPYYNAAPGQYQDDFHMALYNNGNLLQEFIRPGVTDPNSGLPPSCNPPPSVVNTPQLNLQVMPFECNNSQDVQWKIRITNEGTSSVDLHSLNLAVAMWFNQPGMTVTAEWTGSGQRFNYLGAIENNVFNPTNINSYIPATSLGTSCGPSSDRQATQVEMLPLPFPTGSILQPGDYLQELQFKVTVAPSNWIRPITDYSQCNSNAETDFTSVKIVGCQSAFITTNNGEILYCPNIQSAYLSGDGSSYYVIKGGSVCPSDSRPISTLAYVNNQYLEIGGPDGLFNYANYPLPSAVPPPCTGTFLPIPTNGYHVSCVNDISQADNSGPVYAVGCNGMALMDSNPAAPPSFTDMGLNIPSSETLNTGSCPADS